jgi:hypothetical protein
MNPNTTITLQNSQSFQCNSLEIGHYTNLTSIKVAVNWTTRSLMKESAPVKLEIDGNVITFNEFYIDGCIFDCPKQTI